MAHLKFNMSLVSQVQNLKGVRERDFLSFLGPLTAFKLDCVFVPYPLQALPNLAAPTAHRQLSSLLLTEHRLYYTPLLFLK